MKDKSIKYRINYNPLYADGEVIVNCEGKKAMIVGDPITYEDDEPRYRIRLLDTSSVADIVKIYPCYRIDTLFCLSLPYDTLASLDIYLK